MMGGELAFIEEEVWVALWLAILIAGALLLLMGLKKTLKSPIKKAAEQKHQHPQHTRKPVAS